MKAKTLALRYRFFFRSQNAGVLYPKFKLRVLLYLSLVALIAWLGWLIRIDEHQAPILRIAFIPFVAMACITQILFGEWAFRIQLVAEKSEIPFFLPLALNLCMGVAVPRVQTFMVEVWLYTVGVAHKPLQPVLDHWMYVNIAVACLMALTWFLLRKISRRYFPFTSEESSFLRPMPTHFVLAKSQQKEFMQWYERDAFDEVLFDAKHADEFSEEAYHKYRMEIARSYLDTPPYQLQDLDNVLMMDVVFVLMSEYEPDTFVKDCALTIHHGELMLENHRVESDNKQFVHIRYGEKQLRLLIGTGYSAMNRLIINMAKLVAPGYGIRECRVVGKDVEPYFMSLPIAEWRQLEEEYGKAKMKRYFKPVDANYKGLSYYDTGWYKTVAFIRLPAVQWH